MDPCIQDTYIPFDEKEDEFYGLLKLLFFDIPNHKLTKCVNAVVVVYYLLTTLLHVHYLITDFDLELITRYATMLVVIGYALTTAVFIIMLENVYRELEDEFYKCAWSPRTAGAKHHKTIISKSKRDKFLCYSLLGIGYFSSIINSPIWGDQSELFVTSKVFERYFKTWSKIQCHIFFAALPLGLFSLLRFIFLFLMYSFKIRAQISLISRKMLDSCEDFDLSSRKIDNTVYQNKIRSRLIMCIKHHIFIKNLLAKINEEVQKRMPFTICFAIMVGMSFIFFILNFFSTLSNIATLRLLIFCVLNIFMNALFNRAGQDLVDETGRLFDTFSLCPWYTWNVGTRRIMLNFLTNSVKPTSVAFCDFAINYRLAAAVFRTALLNALTLYQIRNMY